LVAGVDRAWRETSLIKEHVLRLAAGSVEHEIRSATAQSLGGLIDQITLPRLGADVDGYRCLSMGLSHGQFLYAQLPYNSV
jgi:hypothetical protein